MFEVLEWWFILLQKLYKATNLLRFLTKYKTKTKPFCLKHTYKYITTAFYNNLLQFIAKYISLTRKFSTPDQFCDAEGVQQKPTSVCGAAVEPSSRGTSLSRSLRGIPN